MKRSSRAIAPARVSTVVLKLTALARVRAGLVSNFNRIGSDDNPDGGNEPLVGADGGPTGMW